MGLERKSRRRWRRKGVGCQQEGNREEDMVVLRNHIYIKVVTIIKVQRQQTSFHILKCSEIQAFHFLAWIFKVKTLVKLKDFLFHLKIYQTSIGPHQIYNRHHLFQLRGSQLVQHWWEEMFKLSLWNRNCKIWFQQLIWIVNLI